MQGKTLMTIVATRDSKLAADPNTLMLIDECDTVLCDLLLNPKAAFIIGLTATPLLNMQGNEKILVSNLLNFREDEGGEGAECSFPVLTQNN